MSNTGGVEDPPCPYSIDRTRFSYSTAEYLASVHELLARLLTLPAVAVMRAVKSRMYESVLAALRERR